eukprot:1161026-Pelagomonas_calceolata.AAC.9
MQKGIMPVTVFGSRVHTSQMTVHGHPRWVEGLQGVGLQPENLADRLLVKHSHPASKIETSSDGGWKTGEELCPKAPHVYMPLLLTSKRRMTPYPGTDCGNTYTNARCPASLSWLQGKKPQSRKKERPRLPSPAACIKERRSVKTFEC